MIKLFNTLGRQLQEFKPINTGQVKFYSCGPTVYDYPQIGNLRTFVFYDTLRRALESSGLRVEHVMNITDVGHLISDGDDGEDKLEKGARREGTTAQQVASQYTQAFMDDMAALNNLKPHYAKATEFIPAQVQLVALLLDKGFAYKTEQAIYFDISKLADYGKLTGQKLSDKEVAARAEVTTDTNKRTPQDFAVWFFTVGKYKNHQMRWPSPWGEGFPGWHAECSAIVHETLGEPIDIHAGGVDLIGTHHTNEMAQTKAAYGKELANFWIHGEHLLVNGKKMSKSSGNFLTLKDVTAKGYGSMSLRLLFLQSHYRSQMNFTWKALDGANNLLKRLGAWSDLRFQDAKSAALETNYQASLAKLTNEIANDLNTPAALATLSQMVGAADDLGTDSTAIAGAVATLDELLGLQLGERADITPAQKNLINERNAFRASHDFAKSDELRQKLLTEGIELNDTPHGSVWSRV